MKIGDLGKKKLAIYIPGIFLFIFLFLLFLTLPVYEKEDESFRSIFDGGNKYWHDGISPLMFAHFENYLKNKEVWLPDITEIDEYNELNVSSYVDEICVNRKCYPIFYTVSLHGFFEFLKWMKKIFPLNTLQYLLVVNSATYAFSVMLLFFILNRIEKKPILNFFVSATIGLGTSFFIYPKYLFLHNTLQTFFFVLFLYSFLLFEEKKSNIIFIFFTFSSILFIVSWQALASIVIAIFMVFWFTYFNFKKINRKFYIAYTFLLGIVVLVELKVFLDFFFMSAEAKKPIFGGRSLFYNLYNESFHAIDFVPVSPIYSTIISNALFLKFYPLFGFFFGARGIFVNSPFLLFSLPGIITFSNKRLKDQLLAILIFFILAFAYLHADYEGGFSPRYVRHSEIIIIILSIFLTSYISKLNNKIILLIFILFVSISVTNSISLAIRTDWNYEKITDLVSYDIVLWPWIPFKQESIVLDLTKVSEQSKWNFTWEAGCNPPNTPPIKTNSGILLGPCACTYSNSIERMIYIPKNLNTLKLSACTTSAGLDGIMVYLKIDEREWPLFFNSNSCKDYYINISDFADDKNHKISIYTGVYGICNDEHVYLKKIELLPISSNENLTQDIYNLLLEYKAWNSTNKNCEADYVGRYFLTNVCSNLESAKIERYVYIKAPALLVEACSPYIGDGTLGIISLGNYSFKLFLKSLECRKVIIDVSSLVYTVQKISLTNEPYGDVSDDIVIWKNMTFLGINEINEDFVLKKNDTYNLAGERKGWILEGEANCLPSFINDHIFVDKCFCMFYSNVNRFLDKKSYVLNITACSRYAGGDGTILVITLDGTKQLKVFLEPNICKKLEYFEPNGFKNITFTVESYGLCYDEGVLIKELMIN